MLCVRLIEVKLTIMFTETLMEHRFLPPQSQSILLLLFLFALSILYFVFRRSTSDDVPAYPPGLEPYPLLGHLPQFVKNRHRLADWFAECLAATPSNSFVLCRPGGIRDLVTANPVHVEHILRGRFENYPKGPRFISLLHDFLGDGIFNSDGEAWRIQRKTASFEFNTKSLRSFVLRVVRDELLGRLLPRLNQAAAQGAVLDLQDLLQRFAFDNICKVAFNQDPSCLSPDTAAAAQDPFSSHFECAFNDASDISSGRFLYSVPKFWMVKKLFGVGSERRLKEAITTVHEFAVKIIRAKKKEKQTSSVSTPSSLFKAEDLLSRFVANEDHSEDFLRDIVVSFMLAGKDTTSSALTWFFWLLSSHPEVEAKILAEIKSIRARRHSFDDDALDFEDLREMNYLHASLTESMRLYPPVPFNTLHCLADDVLPDGTAVKKGWLVTYTSYSMGRMQALWGSDFEEFKPERWLEAETGAFRPESPFKYPVFHGGPRMCLGKEMAYIQMKSIAACVLERFVVAREKEAPPPEVMATLTLKMKGGLAVRVRGRENSS
ncbi:cytochrome P450 CYP94D108-like [Curcuma longa]|uniref:cytochrome P450 CYP94D108-like n=1 Tax=Curcuma longa TaxID=136217 RepID=UPI003D9EF7A4